MKSLITCEVDNYELSRIREFCLNLSDALFKYLEISNYLKSYLMQPGKIPSMLIVAILAGVITISSFTLLTPVCLLSRVLNRVERVVKRNRILVQILVQQDKLIRNSILSIPKLPNYSSISYIEI